MIASRYFDDFEVGSVFETAPVTLSEADIVSFAGQYDPQPMHTDPEAASHVTGGLIASGWHTASLSMKMLLTSGHYDPAPGSLGLGVEHLTWVRPVRPEDAIRLRIEIKSGRVTKSKQGFGILTLHLTTLNQRDEIVQTMDTMALIPKRQLAA